MSTRSCSFVWPSRRGQSLVEFALMLPVFLLVVFGVVQLILLLRADGAVNDVARQAASVVALSGGESSSVDTRLASLASAEGLTPSLLTLQVSTTGSDGATHAGEAHAADVAASSPPPPPTFDGDVTVAVSYAATMDLPLVGPRTVILSAQATQASTAFGGEVPAP